MAGLRAKGKIAHASLGDIIKQEATKKVYALMSQRAENLAQNISHLYKGGLGFNSVTGNLYTSIGVSVVRNDPKNGKYVISQTFFPYQYAGGRPKRKPLKAGETYDLPYYYSGMPVNAKDKNGKPRGFRAPMDGGMYYGPERSSLYRRGVSEATSTSKKKWAAVYLYMNMPYAKSVNDKYNGKVFEILRTLLRRSFGK